jgi:hypothetical protein
MALTIVYEPQYKLSGWFDDGGMSMDSWFDRILAGTIIALVQAELMLWHNPNAFFVPPPITVEVLPTAFENRQTFFAPLSVRTLTQPDQMIKNEVRRLR